MEVVLFLLFPISVILLFQDSTLYRDSVGTSLESEHIQITSSISWLGTVNAEKRLCVHYNRGGYSVSTCASPHESDITNWGPKHHQLSSDLKEKKETLVKKIISWYQYSSPSNNIIFRTLSEYLLKYQIIYKYI